jgi:hypothetical protein
MVKLVHLQILIKKLDTLPNEDFHSYWRDSHPQIWLNVAIVKKNVLKYSQFHVDNKTSAGLKTAGLPMAEFDGGVNIWGRSLEELMAVSSSKRRSRGLPLMLSRCSMMKST